MKISFTDTHRFEKEIFERINHDFQLDIDYLDFRLNAKTALAIESCDVVCAFVNDKLDRDCLKILKEKGVKLIALRSAGFNHVDLKSASEFGLKVCRVPNYSPNAVAEFALGLVLSLNRKIHRSNNRVHELNFSLDGLVGFDLNGKTIGIIGAGRIGKIFTKAMLALGCRVLICDPAEDVDLKKNTFVQYCDLKNLCQKSDVISLHLPLTPESYHLINYNLLSQMKKGVLLVNTSRGAIIDTPALIDALKAGHVGGAALDVYEEEEDIFFQDLSQSVLQDDILARLLTFPNVLITSHQGFLTHEALQNIARITCESIKSFFHDGSIRADRLINYKALQ